MNFFDTPKFPKHWRDVHNFFGTVRPKNFARKRDTLYYTWNLWIPQLFWNTERMRRKFFGTVRQKVFKWKVWYPLLCIKFPVTPSFLKRWRDAHEIFRHCETKISRRKNVIPFTIHDTFWYPNFFETLSGCPQKI